jgi:hypothetical protein
VKRHRLDPFSLLFGALFVGVGLSFLLGSTIGDAKRALWPLFAIIVGCTFVAWAMTTVVRERSPAAISTQPAEEETPEPADET